MTEATYEKRDAKGGFVLLLLVIGLVLLIITIIGFNEFFIYEKEKLIHKVDLSAESVLLRKINVRQTEKLNSFALLDSAKGIARIPIEDAMKLMVEKKFLEKSLRDDD
jgi:ATP/ADP translocase